LHALLLGGEAKGDRDLIHDLLETRIGIPQYESSSSWSFEVEQSSPEGGSVRQINFGDLSIEEAFKFAEKASIAHGSANTVIILVPQEHDTSIVAALYKGDALKIVLATPDSTSKFGVKILE